MRQSSGGTALMGLESLVSSRRGGGGAYGYALPAALALARTPLSGSYLEIGERGCQKSRCLPQAGDNGCSNSHSHVPLT